MNSKSALGATVITGIFIIGVLLFQANINDKIKNERKTVKKLVSKTNIISLDAKDKVFTVGIADYYYSDLIIPTNEKLDFFYISSDAKATTIIKKDTVPTIKEYTTIVYRKSKFLFFPEKWEVKDSNKSFILIIPKNSFIKKIKDEKELDSIKLYKNIIV